MLPRVPESFRPPNDLPFSSGTASSPPQPLVSRRQARRARLHARDYDPLVSKGRDNFESSADGREISLQSGNLAIVETFPALKPGDVGLVHLRHTGDIHLGLSCRLAESSQR
jgi:hypothetical protein